MTFVHSPPNEQLRIDGVWMFVSIDETGEGVCAAPIGKSRAASRHKKRGRPQATPQMKPKKLTWACDGNSRVHFW
jgi:hypothetical protein